MKPRLRSDDSLDYGRDLREPSRGARRSWNRRWLAALARRPSSVVTVRLETIPARNARRLDGKTALVTGGGGTEDVSSVGRAIARLLAAEGATVAVLDRDRSAAEQTVTDIGLDGGSGFAVIADVTVDRECEHAIDEVVAQAGPLAALVNNVGRTSSESLVDIDESAYDAVMAVNVKGAVLMAKYAVPNMQVGSSIINVSSIAAERPGNATAYGVSKAALEGLTRAMAMQLGKDGIRANCVRPGGVWSALVARNVPLKRVPKLRAERIGVNLLGIEGTVWDIAEAVAFLASDAARFINGQILTIDGGSLLRFDRPYKAAPNG